MTKALVGIKFDANDKRLLVKVCRQRGEDVSNFVRRSVLNSLAELGYLDPERAKALGLTM